MDDFGKISSFESLPLPDGPDVKDFDAAQAATKKAARAAKTAVSPPAVTRQMSRNLVVMPAAAPSGFQSVSDFVEVYKATDQTIADMTGKFVEAADVAKQKQDDIVPHLAFMQALLSKKGANHELVIEARKQGNKIPWWTEYYRVYKDRLWQSLRTMERRIAAYRKDPSVSTTKPGNGGSEKPKHLTQLEHKLLGTAVNAREAIVDLRAGRIDEAIAKLDKHTPTQDRIAEHLERGVSPTLANPDGKAKPRTHELEPTTTTAAAELTVALANEPDRDIASKLLTDYLRGVAMQFANDRIKIREVNATVIFVPEVVAPNAEARKKLGALETTNAVRGMTSSEIKQLIANPKSHSYDLVALKVALSAKLSAEAEAPR